MATYAIGDVQGCFDELQILLDKIKFKPDKDQLWFTGDLVNRGPKSLETLRLIYNLRDNAIVVLGNHDLHLMATVFDHEQPGRKDTTADILAAPDKYKLLDWLRCLPLIHTDHTICLTMVHAGLHPDWSIEKAHALSTEVELTLQGDNHVDFYRHMYGDKPAMWTDGLKSWSRLRFITNIMTRLRYCNNQGKVALGVKGAPGTQSDGLYPWFDIPWRKSRNNLIIFGHWSTLVLNDNAHYSNVYPLDTGCLWGGKLTAMRIDKEPYEFIKVECPKSSQPY